MRNNGLFVVAILVLLSINVLADDHGNSASQATEIKLNKHVLGKLEVKGDVDYFKFAAKRNVTYTVTILDKKSLHLTMMDKKEKVLTEDQGYGKSNTAMLVYMNNSRGYLYFSVQGTTGNVKGSYMLNVASQKTKRNGPYARADHAMAYSDDLSKTVMYGGAFGGNFFDDAWTWDGYKWKFFKTGGPDGTPGYRTRSYMAYDKDRGVIVMFGGRNRDGVKGDTWELEGKTWKKVDVSGPAERYGHSMIYDDANKRIIMFGGTDGTSYYNDLWSYDGTEWTPLEDQVEAPAGEAPIARDAFGMVWRPYYNDIFISGGKGKGVRAFADTWRWTADGGWENIADNSWGPKGRSSHGVAFNVEDGNVYMFGGYNGFNKNLNDMYYLYSYSWDATSYYYWYTMYVENNSRPSERSGAVMVYDAFRRELVLFGGWNNGYLKDDTWIFTNREWHKFD